MSSTEPTPDLTTESTSTAAHVQDHRAIPGAFDRMPLGLAVAYLASGLAWIFFSDRFLSFEHLDAEQMLRLQTYKGWGFVVVSAGLIYVLLRHYARRCANALEELKASENRLLATEQQIRKINSELEQRVEERTQQLEAANRELEAFAYAVSHDLRAPLRSISGFSQALRETASETLESKTMHYLQRIQDASAKMAHLIDDLLQLSRIQRSEMAPRRTDLTQLFAECAAAMNERYPGRTVRIEIDPGMSVHGDPRLLRIAVENLIDNAWKYTVGNPEALVKVGRTEVGSERNFYVSDNGIGFNMAYADKLFAPFQRLHSDAQFPGTGIGLCTVQRILRRHGGRIWAESQPNVGTTFWFTLPGE